MEQLGKNSESELYLIGNDYNFIMLVWGLTMHDITVQSVCTFLKYAWSLRHNNVNLTFNLENMHGYSISFQLNYD